MHFEFFVAFEWVRDLHQRPLRLSLIRLEKPQPLLFYRSAKVQFSHKIAFENIPIFLQTKTYEFDQLTCLKIKRKEHQTQRQNESQKTAKGIMVKNR